MSPTSKQSKYIEFGRFSVGTRFGKFVAKYDSVLKCYAVIFKVNKKPINFKVNFSWLAN